VVRSSAVTSTRVRARIAADDAFVERLSASAFAEYSRYPGHSTLEMARAGRTWVAQRAGVPVGFATVRGTGDSHAELCAIAVDESARGLGVGAALLREVIRALARGGTSVLTLHTAEANSSALELFSKHGFRTERHLPAYYRGVFDACLMRRQLGSTL
jgi:ribosomal protein S18 acetylase RimI-like enzyme